MRPRQFIMMALFTAAETYFFNEAMMAEQYLFAIFWGMLVLRNLQTSYMIGKLAQVIEKEIKKRK